MTSGKDKISIADTLPVGTTTEDLGLPRPGAPASQPISGDVVTADSGGSHVHGSASLGAPAAW